VTDSPTVVVTGAAGGIGRAICREYAGAGARVVALDIDGAGLDALGSLVEGLVLDVTDPSSTEEAMLSVGPIDVLIHCAGITSLGPFAETPLQAFDHVFDLNVRAAVAVTRSALPGLMARRGRIGVLSSVAGFSPLLYRTAYSASKHALHGFFESLRVELAADGVSVTMVCPSFVDTGIEDRAAHHAPGAAGTWTTTGQVMPPERLAELIRSAVSKRRRLVLPSSTARLAYAVSRISPSSFDRLMRRRIQRNAGS